MCFVTVSEKAGLPIPTWYAAYSLPDVFFYVDFTFGYSGKKKEVHSFSLLCPSLIVLR